MYVPKWYKTCGVVLVSILVVVVFCYFINIHRPTSSVTSKPIHMKQLPSRPKMIEEQENIDRRLELEVEREMERMEEKTKVEMDPPEIKKLKDLLSDFMTDESRWDVLIAIGDVYRKGAYPRFLPDEYIALNCYKTAAMSPDGDVAGLAQAKYIETRTEKIEEEDKNGEPLPTIYGERACEIGFERVRNTPFSMFSSKPKMKKVTLPETRREATRRDTQTTNYDYLFQANDGFGFDDFNFDINTFNNTETTAYRHDSQNVHDHSVVNATKRNLEKLGSSSDTSLRDVDSKLAQIKIDILSNGGVTDKESSDALRVIESLSETTSSTFGVSEKEALVNAWKKIQDQSDPTLKKNLTETLTKQLATAVEHGHVVCSTGKITRIVSTFDGTDVENMDTAKPLWAVKEEIANLAAKIRDDKLDKISPADKQAYERGSHPTLDDEMKREFRDKAFNTYCNELKMNQSIIEPIIKTYEEAF